MFKLVDPSIQRLYRLADNILLNKLMESAPQKVCQIVKPVFGPPGISCFATNGNAKRGVCQRIHEAGKRNLPESSWVYDSDADVGNPFVDTLQGLQKSPLFCFLRLWSSTSPSMTVRSPWKDTKTSGMRRRPWTACFQRLLWCRNDPSLVKQQGQENIEYFLTIACSSHLSLV